METIVVPAMVVALVAAYPGYQLLHRAYFTSRRWWKAATLVSCFVLPPLIATSLFYIPFFVNAGGELTWASLFTDFVLYSICPAAFIALIGWFTDSISDMHRPRRLVAAGTSCFAIVFLPIMFYFYAPTVAERNEIKLELVGQTDAPQSSQNIGSPNEDSPSEDTDEGSADSREDNGDATETLDSSNE